MDTQHLLRPNQREEMEADRRGLENSLKSPSHPDRSTATRQLRTLNKQLDEQSPKPFSSDEIDTKVRRETQLKKEILEGMPSQEEMRKSPPGAVGKHQAWEKANKEKILEWKNLMLRINHDSTDPDIANFEKHRPVSNTLNMDNAVIQGQQFHFMPDTPQFKQGYDNVNWDSEKEAELKKLRKEAKPKGMSPENRKAASDRMKTMHAKKKAAKTAKEK